MDYPTPLRREDQRRRTRRRIVDAARARFYERGSAEVSMEEVARAAGVGRATLYLHFPNKEAILLDLMGQNLAAVKRIFAELCVPDAPDLSGVQAWLRGYVETLRAHRDAARLVRIGIGAAEDALDLIHAHRLAVAEMLAARFGRLAKGGDATQVRLLLVIARVDDFASAAAASPPRIDLEAGLELVGRELLALLR